MKIRSIHPATKWEGVTRKVLIDKILREKGQSHVNQEGNLWLKNKLMTHLWVCYVSLRCLATQLHKKQFHSEDLISIIMRTLVVLINIQHDILTLLNRVKLEKRKLVTARNPDVSNSTVSVLQLEVFVEMNVTVLGVLIHLKMKMKDNL